MPTIKSYKGFDKDLKCRGFQYEIGKEYETDSARVCYSGFHACEAPLDVFNHYGPVGNRFCLVEQSGEISRDGDGTKVASTKIKIGAENGIPGLVKAHIEYVKSRCTNENNAESGKPATAGDYGAATAGSYGAATARGSVTVGDHGVATVRGNGVKARGGMGAILTICIEEDDSCDIKEWKTIVVDGDCILPNIWYTLRNGEIVTVEEGGD